MRVRTYAFALCMLVLSPAWADPQVPEGFGQREHTLGPAWVYTPGRELVRLSESQSRLSANSWLLAKLSPYEGLTLLGGRGKVEVYQLRVVGAQSGPSDQETLPPLGLALLGSQLATRHLAGGREGLRIEVGLRPSAGWIGVRAREACQVRLVGLRPEPVPESWERWTRRIRAASDPQDPWPARLANPHSVLLGHGVEEFMSAQQVMLPWAPSEDDAAARSVRVGALLLGSLTVRPLVGGHFHTQPWPKPETPTFLERFGKRGRRAYALADTPQERTVTGPAVVRLWIRGTWSHQDATEDHTLRLRITLDGRDRFEQLIPQVDLGASTTLREDAATSAALAARNLKQVLLSTPQEVRVTIPPGDHELSVAPITSNTWLAVESATRIEQLEQPRALSYLDVPLGEGERSRVLMALVHDLLGEPVAAAAALRALLKGQAPRVRVWAALRLLKLGREAGLPEGLDRARQLLEESLKAPKPLPRLLAPALKELVADAIATKRAIPPAWIEALLKAPLLTPTDLALAHAALAASPGIAGQRVFALPSLVGEGGQLRRLFVATAAQRTHHGRFALLPRLGGGLPSRRFVQPLEIAPGGPETSPSVAWDWKSALGKTGRAYLRIQPPTTELILNGDGPLELLAVDAERPAEWVIERGQRTLTPGALPSSRPLLLDLPAGKIRLRGEPNTAPLLAAGGFRPTDGEWCRVLDLEPLPRSLRREEPDARYQLSSSTWPGVARLRIGVSRADPGAFVDQLFELAVEGRAEPLRFRFVLIPAPGSVTRTSVGQASFVVPPGSARVLLTAPGRPKGLELFASLDEQVYRRPALETTQRRARWLPPPELLELLEGPLDYRDHSKLRQITLRIERLPGSRVDERIALLERRVRILVKLDDLSAARRDLLAALESLRTLARSERRDEARLRLNLAAATLAWETGSRLRLRYHLGELESAAGETLDLLRAALAEAIGSPREARAYLERAALQRGERPPTDLEHVVAAGLGQRLAGRIGSSFLRVRRDLSLLAREGSGLERAQLEQRLVDLERELLGALTQQEEDGHAARSVRLSRFVHALQAAQARLGSGARVLDTGALDPLARLSPLPADSIVEGTQTFLLGGGDGKWPASLIRRGEQLSFVVSGPTTLSIGWRSVHRAEPVGKPRRHAQPARYLLSGLPGGPQARTLLRSRPSPEVELARPTLSLPDADAPDAAGWRMVPGVSDRFEISVPPGRHSLTLRCTHGQGFVVLRRWSGRWLIATRLDGQADDPATPTELDALAPRPGAALGPDADRRLELLLKNPKLRALPSARALADDLLLSVVSETEPDSERFVAALALERMIDSGSADLEHTRRHARLAKHLARRRSVDLSTQLRRFRRLQLDAGSSKAPRLTMFHPFEGEGSRILGEGEARVWRLHEEQDVDLYLEVAADLLGAFASTGQRALIRVLIEDKVALEAEVPYGSRALLAVAKKIRKGRVAIRIEAGRADEGLLARVRLRRVPSGGSVANSVPLIHRPLTRVHPVHGETLELPSRGLAALDLHYWPPAGLELIDGQTWRSIHPAKRLGGPQLGGGGSLSVKLPASGFVRLVRSDLDPRAHAALRSHLEEVAVQGFVRPAPALEVLPWQLPETASSGLETPEAWSHDFVLEAYARAIPRHREQRRFQSNFGIDEGAAKTEYGAGLRLHHRYRDWPLYTRLGVGGIKPEGQANVLKGELRSQLYLTDSPRVSLRLQSNYLLQRAGGDLNQSLDSDLRLRIRSFLPAGFQLLLDGHLRYWDTTVAQSKARTDPTFTRDVYRPISNGYRYDHPQWLETFARLRWYPYQNAWLEAYVGGRSNHRLAVWNSDRALAGAKLRYHYEWLFFEAGFDHVYRFSDRDRRRATTENFLVGKFTLAPWLGPRLRASLSAGARYAIRADALSVVFELRLWFSAKGARNRAVDPELIPFSRYQDAVYPWPSSEDLPPEGDEP